MLKVRETKIRKRSHDFAQHKNDSFKFPNLLASKFVDGFILYLQNANILPARPANNSERNYA